MVKALYKERELGKDYEMWFGKLLRRCRFSHFSLLVTERGVLFESYTGYHIWTTPFVTGLDGTTSEKSLYVWLMRLVELRDAVESSGRDVPYEGADMSSGDVLDAMVLLTECNLMEPQVVFLDIARASERALSYMAWLRSQMESLGEVMSGSVTGDVKDDERILSEDMSSIVRGEVLGEMLKELGDGLA